MEYTQVLFFNINTPGEDDECLVYVHTGFGIGDKYDDATDAWNNAQFKQTGTPPTNISVPIWFSWTGTIDGVTKNWGHVGAWVNGKIYSTTAQGVKVFDSIQDLMNFIQEGIQYLGWSEDINGTQVVTEGESMIQDNAHLNSLFMAYLNRGPSASDTSGYVGKITYSAMIELLDKHPEHIAFEQFIAESEKNTVLAPGTYRVQ